MIRLSLAFVLVLVVSALVLGFRHSESPEAAAFAQEPDVKVTPNNSDIQRSRRRVNTLDNVFKQTIVLITDKYVHDEDDFAAGSAAVLLFKNVSESSEIDVRLIDVTGDPYDPENVAKDPFEKEGVKLLKNGATGHEQVITQEGKPYLRALTPVPVVMQKCVMCHSHYEDAKKGEAIGAISYTIPIE